MHGKVIWKPRIAEIVKAPRDVAPESLKGKGGGGLQCTLEPLAARVNMLMHVALWPTAIKLNPSWKTEINKSAWVKPWSCICFGWVINLFRFYMMFFLPKMVISSYTSCVTPHYQNHFPFSRRPSLSLYPTAPLLLWFYHHDFQKKKKNWSGKRKVSS